MEKVKKKTTIASGMKGQRGKTQEVLEGGEEGKNICGSPR